MKPGNKTTRLIPKLNSGGGQNPKGGRTNKEEKLMKELEE
jgi:hypothetical protein